MFKRILAMGLAVLVVAGSVALAQPADERAEPTPPPSPTAVVAGDADYYWDLYVLVSQKPVKWVYKGQYNTKGQAENAGEGLKAGGSCSQYAVYRGPHK